MKGKYEKSLNELCFNTHEKKNMNLVLNFMLERGNCRDDSDEERKKESATESTMHFMAYYKICTILFKEKLDRLHARYIKS